MFSWLIRAARTKTALRPFTTSAAASVALTAFISSGIIAVSLCSTAALLAAPVAAHAQSSSIASVSLPHGAEPVSDRNLKGGMGKLLAKAADLFKLPEGGDGNAEVYYWTGSNYKAGRAVFMQTLLQSALTEAGYSVTTIDSHVSNVPNMFDTSAYDIGSLDIHIFGDQSFYFHATNPTNKKTIVGFWLDQDSHKRVVLALAQAGFEAGPAATHVPDVTDPDTWLVKNLKNATAGMPSAPLPTFPSLAPKPGTVRGMVKDGNGKPIANAHLIATSSAAGGFRTSHNGYTNAQGIYEISLPLGVCQIVNADCKVSANDKTLVLPLYPVDGVRDEFLSKSGHVENFVLRTSGEAEGGVGGSYGAPLRILTYKTPENSIVEVRLKPNGPLADGSRGKTLLIRFKSAKPGISSTETIIGGIPLGSYTLTACVFDGDDALNLRARRTFKDSVSDDDQQLASSLNVEFESRVPDIASPGQSGLKRFEVTLEP